MDIDRLPRSLLLALGLGCGPSAGPDDMGGGEATGSGAGTDPSTSGGGSESHDTGAADSTLDPETTVGPCLKYDIGGGRETTTGESSSSDSSDSDSGSGEGTDTTGDHGCVHPPGVLLDGDGPVAHVRSSPARGDVIDRLVAAGVLPRDVARKLAK